MSRSGGSARRRITIDLLALLVIVGLLGAVYLLPPDTSLRLVKESGVLRVCVPTQYPPLVTGNPQQPGVDVEILAAVAEEMEVRLVLNTNSAIGRDWNPRNWRVTRAQCQLLAGGVVGSETTRSFLETTHPHLETGWALIVSETISTLEGATVGFYAGVSGLDRIALSRFLRNAGARPVIVRTDAELVDGLTSGRFDVGVSEALTARHVAGENGWRTQWLPSELGRYPIVIGMWKGDLTLKRGVERAIERLERDGELAAVLEAYHLAPIADTCAPCIESRPES